ncbi:MAG: TolB family protein [Bdellovibrionales bacterium]
MHPAISCNPVLSVALACILLTSCAPFRSDRRGLPTDSPELSNPASPTVTADYLKANGMLLTAIPAPGSADISTGSIYKSRPDGAEKVLLTDDGSMPSWTPDGDIIFVSSRSGTSQIWLMSVEGHNPRQVGLIGSDIFPAMPLMSRNGLIVFMAVTNVGGAQSIWKMQSDGTGLEKLVGENMIPSQPSLALSGIWITFTSETEEPYHRQIWRIHTDGTNLKQLTFLGDPDYPDANASMISPDEKWVAFFSGKESDKGEAGRTQHPDTWGHRNVAVIPATGGPRRNLTSCKPTTEQVNTGHGYPECIAADNPTWSPDGRWILHDTDASGIWMIDVNGQNSQQLSTLTRHMVRVPLRYMSSSRD